MRGGASSGPLDHDNSEGVHATLDAAWARTLDAWHDAGKGGEEDKEGLALAAVPSGAERRGEGAPGARQPADAAPASDDDGGGGRQHEDIQDLPVGP